MLLFSLFTAMCALLWLPANGIPGNRAEEILFVGGFSLRQSILTPVMIEKLLPLPWARKPEMTCFLAQGTAEALL